MAATGPTPPVPAATRRRVGLVVALAVGLGLATLLVVWLAPWHTARPVTLSGAAYADADATAIGFAADSRLAAWRWGLSPEGEGFVVAGVPWTDVDGTTYEGTPPACLEAGATAPVELSFVRIAYGRGEGGPTRVVTGLRCLG
jgi:hypothetical protein